MEKINLIYILSIIFIFLRTRNISLENFTNNSIKNVLKNKYKINFDSIKKVGDISKNLIDNENGTNNINLDISILGNLTVRDKINSVNGLIENTGTALKVIEEAEIDKLEGFSLTSNATSNIVFLKNTIIMWSGAISSIPKGWLLCDGTNNTPDLRDRFVVGVNQTYNLNSTGGENEVTLTVSQLPSHTHTGTIDSHSHNHETSSKMHEPNIPRPGGGHGAAWTSNSKNTDKNNATYTSAAGNHNHTININNTGGGNAHENKPPYYSLCFIMKK